MSWSSRFAVFALNQLYSSLSSPFLTGWIGNGGDPCAENWEGVACAGPNVTLLYNFFAYFLLTSFSIIVSILIN